MKKLTVLFIIIMSLATTAAAQDSNSDPLIERARTIAAKRASMQLEYVVDQNTTTDVNGKVSEDRFEVSIRTSGGARTESYRRFDKSGKLGKPKTTSYTDAQAGTSGEYFSDLLMVLKPEARALFLFSRIEDLSGARCKVYTFTVEQVNSELILVSSGLIFSRRDTVAFKGEIYIGVQDANVYRLHYEAVGIPKKSDYLRAEKTLDFGYVNFAGSDEEYLVPTHAKAYAHAKGAVLMHNQIQYENYRVFQTGVKVQYEAEDLPNEDFFSQLEKASFRLQVPHLDR